MDTREVFCQSLKPTAIICSIFGIFPISFTHSSAKVSKLKVFYGLCLSALVTGSLSYCLLFFIPSGAENIIFKFAGVTYPIMTIGGCWVYLFQAKSTSKLMNDIFLYSKFVKNYKFFSKINWILLGQLIILISLALSFPLRSIALYPEILSDLTQIFYTILDLLLNVLITLLTFLQTNFLFFMYKVFHFFNCDLAGIIPSRMFVPSRNYDFVLENNVKKYQKNSGRNHVDVEALTLLHEKIYETCKTLNSVFGATASASAAYTLIQTVFSLYYLVASSVDFVCTILKIVLVVLELWMLCFACEVVVNEVREILVIGFM